MLVIKEKNIREAIQIAKEEKVDCIVDYCYESENSNDFVPQSFYEAIIIKGRKIVFQYKGELKCADKVEDIIEFLQKEEYTIKNEEE